MSASSQRFVHLHLHSEYSLLDGGNRLDRLINRVKELGMEAVAVTDHGNLFGAAEFYRKAHAAGIKPILGIEAYVALEDRTNHTRTGVKDGGFHLVLLAENNQGWANLLKLSSDSFLNGFYYKPRMDKTTLAQWSDGLIAINGHLGSSIAWHMVKYVQTGQEAHWDEAVAEAKWHAETFGTNEKGEPRFFIELQKHETRLQHQINPHLIKLARELDLPLVGDNDAHFLTADDWDTHDTLCCISMQKIKAEEDRIRYPRDLYVKSPAEMTKLFADVPEAIENSVRIGERCNVELDFDTSHAPVVKVSRTENEPIEEKRGSTEWFLKCCAEFHLEPYDATIDTDLSTEDLKQQCDEALRSLALAGAEWRYGGEGVEGEVRERLDRELGILADKSISAYFLIVWDFVNWARQRGIPANARGSGVGTMVGYVLGLSNACPVEYGLLFERFTDPDRSEYPDIDIDICQNGRADVINYVRQKYGHVAQIITFGRLKAKAAIKDVARVMGLSPTEGQRLSNMVPAELNITLDEALKKDPDLKKRYDDEEQIRTVVDHARALENHARHAGVHAAGVVIATQPLDTIVPLYKAPGSDDVVTQWDGPTCEKVGLLKMDFLGLRTLSTIERARELVQETLPDAAVLAAVGQTAESTEATPHPLDLDRLKFDDPKVLNLFCRGDTAGVFQFESSGMRQLLVEMQPDRFEDLIAANALYRPGPMDLIDEYTARKRGRSPVKPVHDIVDAFTSETYGIMVYQEQVMQIVHGLGGIPLRAAYTLIKAISKKSHAVIDAERPRFIEGAQEKGLSSQQANNLFELILKFAGYGFNKSHSTGYAIIAYQTAYLKTYYPAQYMAALLTFESHARKVEDWVSYLTDCQRTVWPDHDKDTPHIGIDVQPPDINLSEADFSVVFGPDEPRDNRHGHIRFGLSAIKGAGNAAIRGIINARADGPFASIFDFCERVDLKSVNKATIEALVKCGAFDSIHSKVERAALAASVEEAIRAGQGMAADRDAGQSTFFDSFACAEPATEEPEAVTLRSETPWTELEALQFEKDVLGFYASGHPLDEYEATLKSFASHTIAQLHEAADDTKVMVGCIITGVKQTVSRSGRNPGKKMAWITLQDRSGSIEGVAFSETLEKYSHLIDTDSIAIFLGKVDRRRGEPSLVVDRVFTMEAAPRMLATRLEVEVKPPPAGLANVETQLESLKQALYDASTIGNEADGGRAAEVLLHVYVESRRVTIRPSMLKVVADAPLLARLHGLVGEAAVVLQGGPPHLYMGRGRNGNGNGNGYRKSFGGQAGEACASIDRY